MADHNGDYSEEAEYKRKMKREKVQRSRMRKRIAEGRATRYEIAAIDAWDQGESLWDEIIAAIEEVKGETGDQGEQDRAPRTPRARKSAQEEEEKPGNPWVALGVLGGVAAAFVGFVVWIGRNTGL